MHPLNSVVALGDTPAVTKHLVTGSVWNSFRLFYEVESTLPVGVTKPTSRPLQPYAAILRTPMALRTGFSEMVK